MLNGDQREISVFPFQTTGITQINSLCWNVLLPHKSLSRRTRCQIIGCADWGRCWPEAIEQVRTASSIKTSSLNRQPAVRVGTPLYFETLCGLHTAGTLRVYSPDNYIGVCECTIISKPTLWDSVSKINGFASTITNKPQNVQDKHTHCATQLLCTSLQIHETCCSLMTKEIASYCVQRTG